MYYKFIVENLVNYQNKTKKEKERIRMKKSKLWDIIPLKEVNEKLSQYYCELDLEFAGFEYQYRAVANNVPYNYTIIDLGCYMAAQAYLFCNHEAYIGVDMVDDVERFATENTTHYVMSIQEFIKEELPKYKGKKVYAICNYVPDENARDLVTMACENFMVYYPGELLRCKGINAYRIIVDIAKLDEFNKEDNISYLIFLLKNAIVKFFMEEYEEDHFNFDESYDDLSHVGIAYTTTPDGKHEIQFELDLEKLSWRQLVDGVIVDQADFDLGDKVSAIRDLTDFVRNAEFNSMVSVDEDCLKKTFNMGIDNDGNFYELD